MANAKLHINITQGVIEAEGDESFVLQVYEDFKNRVGSKAAGHGVAAESSSNADPSDVGPEQSENGSTTRRKPRRASAGPRATKPNKESGISVTAYSPTLDNTLDTAGLKEFISPYALTNHENTLVVFVKFLETKGIKPATFDQIYTCYRDAQLKLPEAFYQAFIRARGGKGYLTFSTPNDVTLTVRGTNHFEHGGLKMKSEGGK